MARALQREDPSVATPRLDRQLVREVRRRQRRPHIFSAEEIQKLFQSALAFPSPLAPLRPHSLHTMLVLEYCAGLRLGEMVRLKIGDIQIEEGVIEIRETKFFKTQRLPLSTSALAALRSYMEAREKAGGPSGDDSALLWQQQDRCGYSRMTMEGCWFGVSRAGLKRPRPSGRVGPRIHDLRHTFVVHRMTEWYRSGINPEPLLPYLATYLGHKRHPLNIGLPDDYPGAFAASQQPVPVVRRSSPPGPREDAHHYELPYAQELSWASPPEGHPFWGPRKSCVKTEEPRSANFAS